MLYLQAGNDFGMMAKISNRLFCVATLFHDAISKAATFIRSWQKRSYSTFRYRGIPRGMRWRIADGFSCPARHSAACWADLIRAHDARPLHQARDIGASFNGMLYFFAVARH